MDIDDNKPWAFVTGASRGIGRAFCLELIKTKYNAIGVSRSFSDLEEIENLARLHKVKFISLSIDLREEEATDKILIAIKDILPQLQLICLNASINAFGPFQKIPLKTQLDLVKLNIEFPIRFLHALTNLELTSNHLYLFALASQGSIQPVPWMTTYASTKAFLYNFIFSLSEELKSSSITFKLVIPAHTETSAFNSLEIPAEKINKFKKGKPAQDIAQKMIKSMESKKFQIVTNVFGYTFLSVIIALSPKTIILKVASKMFSTFSKEAFFPKK